MNDPEREEQMLQKDDDAVIKAKNTQKQKRIVLIILGAMLLFVILFYVFQNFIDLEGVFKKNNTYNPTRPTIVFATPDYDEDIYADEVYVGLDRSIYICNIESGITESLEEDDYENYDECVRLVADFVNAIIAGDAEKYNSFFDPVCFDNGSVEKKEAFTKQKLYNIKMTRLQKEEVDGYYTKYVYVLEYMIRHNNGTLRLDVESDASRPQYLIITDKSGKLLIENCYTK